MSGCLHFVYKFALFICVCYNVKEYITISKVVMKDAYNKIIEYELLFTELASKQFSEKEDITRGTVKEALVLRGKKIRKVIADTNILIDEHITPLLTNPESLSPEQAVELKEFAEKLSGYKESIDTGLAYDIRTALAKYAKAVNNDELYINSMFFKGLALFYLETHMFKEEMSQCYDSVIEFSDRYEQFNKETRNLIARAYGNSYISVPDLDIKETYRRYDRAYDFWTTRASKVDPGENWNVFYQNLNENICSTTITALRSDRNLGVSEDMRKRLLEAATKLYETDSKDKQLQTNDYTTSQVKHYYYYYAARYYNGLIDSKQLLDLLYSIYKQADNDYNYDDLYKKLHVAGLYLYYLHHAQVEDFTKDDKIFITKEIEADVFNYVMSIPDNMSRSYVTTMLTHFAIGSHHVFDDMAYLKLLLSLTVFRHAPTYVHSVMVSKISYAITEYLIKYHPESFVGLPGFANTEDVKKQAAQILLFVWYAGLVHDIGKIVYSHMVSFYVRKLNDKEFEMIQQHALKAKGFIKASPNIEVDAMVYDTVENVTSISFGDNHGLFSCFSDVAMGHHKSYDGTFGYPKDFNNLESPVKPIIDIISIADSIDAATDTIGRSYAHEKNLIDMKEDLLSQINTRYCPITTQLIFNEPRLYNAIDKIISKDRFDLYFSCFSLNDFSKL